MEQLPQDIEAIIMDYKQELEDCEEKISNALEIFFLIQNRVDEILDDLKVCRCTHSRRLCKVLLSIISEAMRITANVLKDEAVSGFQLQTLLNLQHETFVEIMDSVLHPFFVHMTEMPQEPTYNDTTDEDVPQLYLET